jgi:hypothetical protein
MNRQEQSRMLKEILESEEAAEFRQRALEQGLAAVRRARGRRQALRLGAVLLPVLAVAALVAAHANRPAKVSQAPPHAQTEMASASPTSGASGSAIRFINDEQLFALFPGRSMALIGKPGHQQLVFLDAGKPN